MTKQLIYDDFQHSSDDDISKHIAGKVIEKVIDSEEMNNLLIFHFTDGTSFSIEYDWIYSWRFNKQSD